PSESLTAVRTRPLSWLVTVTVAPGTSAFDASVTVPRTVAVVRCAAAVNGSATTMSAATNGTIMRFRIGQAPPTRGFERTFKKGIIDASRALSRTFPRFFTLATLLLIHCSGLPESKETHLDRRPRSVVLINIDTLRADALGSYGTPAAGHPARE